jgi:5'-deoxynucleotidase
VEDAALSKLFTMLPPELRPSYEELFEYTPDEKKLIKAADKICALLKCREEAHFGNPEFVEAEKLLLQNLQDADCKEADYFLETFGDSFAKPIDTLIQNRK